MTVEVKICGVKSPDILLTAVGAGADYIGFVFYQPSPRWISIMLAAELSRMAPPATKVVGLFVDPDEETLEHVTRVVALDYMQFHGSESPKRLMEIKNNYNLPIIKAVPIAEKKDLLRVRDYHDVADMILFDAKPPKNVVKTLPGGTGIAFDWALLSRIKIPLPWILSGGLTPDNVAQAVHITGAKIVDVSSGVETGPGLKDPDLVRDFIRQAKQTPEQMEEQS